MKTTISSEVTDKRVKLELNGYIIEVDTEKGMAVDVTDPNGSNIMSTSQGSISMDLKGNSHVSGVMVGNRSVMVGNKQTVSPYRESDAPAKVTRTVDSPSFWGQNVSMTRWQLALQCFILIASYNLGTMFFRAAFLPLLQKWFP